MHLWKFEDAKMHVIYIICEKYIKYAKYSTRYNI